MGATGEPAFQHGWVSNAAPVGFYKDAEGGVHLTGKTSGPIGSVIFQLPAGYRPATTIVFAVACDCSALGPGGSVSVTTGSALIAADGGVILYNVAAGNYLFLDGITFRAAS